MKRKPKSTWFNGSLKIDCKLVAINKSLSDIGRHFVEVVSIMPGITKAEVIEQGDNHVKIETNEGVIKRTNITVKDAAGCIRLEFDEDYKASRSLSTSAHFVHEFEFADGFVIHRLIISKLIAPGFKGYLYKKFGATPMGKIYLSNYKTYLEKSGETLS